VPDPYPGESLLSWADALARLNQVSRTVAARMTGMVDSPLVSDIFGYHVSDAVVRAVRHTTGVADEQVRAMALATPEEYWTRCRNMLKGRTFSPGGDTGSGWCCARVPTLARYA